MSERCHICCPVKHEAPTVICAPCALAESSRCADGAGNSSSATDGPRKEDSAPPAGSPYGSGIARAAALWWKLKRDLEREWRIFFGGELR